MELFDHLVYSQYNINMIILIDEKPIAGFFRTDHDPPVNVLFTTINYIEKRRKNEF